MKAAVIREAGGPDVLQIEQLPIPSPVYGQVLIRVRAFGLNRSEMFTRQGLSPGVAFPRVLGIEAVGTVENAPGGEFQAGEKVATAMGGMGRSFDGGHAEYLLVPVAQVQRIESDLPWDVLGAVPEMLQTAWGSLFGSLRLQRGEHLLIRGGTTEFMQTPLDGLLRQIAAGRLHVQIGRTFQLDEIAAAHRCMEENKAGGKIVVLT